MHKTTQVQLLALLIILRTIKLKLLNRYHSHMARTQTCLIRLRFRSHTIQPILHLMKTLLRATHRSRTRTLLRQLNSITNRITPYTTTRRRNLAILMLIHLAIPCTQHKDGHRVHSHHPNTSHTSFQIHHRITRGNRHHLSNRRLLLLGYFLSTCSAAARALHSNQSAIVAPNFNAE